MKDYMFQMQGPKCWNALPQDLRNSKASEFTEFKAECDEFVSTLPIIPRVGCSFYQKKSLEDVCLK